MLPSWSHPLRQAILKPLIKTKTGTSRNVHQPQQVTGHSYYPFPHALFLPLPGWSISASFLIAQPKPWASPRKKLIVGISQGRWDTSQIKPKQSKTIRWQKNKTSAKGTSLCWGTWLITPLRSGAGREKGREHHCSNTSRERGGRECEQAAHILCVSFLLIFWGILKNFTAFVIVTVALLTGPFLHGLSTLTSLALFWRSLPWFSHTTLDHFCVNFEDEFEKKSILELMLVLAFFPKGLAGVSVGSHWITKTKVGNSVRSCEFFEIHTRIHKCTVVN